MNKLKFYSLILLFSVLISEDKKVALVLSGGAAKGYAHIPVLEIIDSLDINIDMIVGTSIGANVGALYSVGYASEDIFDFALRTDWSSIFLEKTNRNDMSYLHKKDESKYQIDFNLEGFTPSIPSSIIYGQRAYLELSKILGQYEYINDFSELYIPFYCNASDLISGQDILLQKGSLITSVRASTSIPSIFAPVEYKDYLLVDGGVTNNIPSNIAKSLGADIIFTINVASSKPEKEEIKASIIDVLGESIFIHTSDLVKKNLELSDYSISIKMPRGNSANFSSKGLEKTYSAGKKQVYNNIDLFLDLKRVSGPKKSKKKLRKLDDLYSTINSIKINGNKNFSSEYIINNLGLTIGDTLKLESIHNGINNLYGLGHFNVVRYSLNSNKDNSNQDIDIFIEESDFNKLQTGLRWDNHHELIAVANLRINDILSPGFIIKNEFQFPGIVRNTFEISYPKTLSNSTYYPFYKNIYYKQNADIYNNNGDKEIQYTSRIINNSIGAGFIFGKNLGLELSLNHELSNLTPLVIQNNSEEYENEITNNISLIIDYDSRDDALIPRNGILANIKLIKSEYNNQNYQSKILEFNIYETWKRNTIKLNYLLRDIGSESLFHNVLFQGKADKNIGYNPYFLNSNRLESAGLEWMYHYKSMYFRLFYNTISQLHQNYNDFNLDNSLNSYGFGITLKSPFGPIELIWGKGPKTLLKSNDRQTLFYVNIGYKF